MYIKHLKCINDDEKRTYNWVMWQMVALRKEQSHLRAGLLFWSSKLIELSVAAPLHISPLIFHAYVVAIFGGLILHCPNMEFNILAAITS